MRLATTATLVLIGLAATATPSPASDELQVRATMSPNTIRHPGTGFITYRLELESRIEQVARISLVRPTFASPLPVGGPGDFIQHQLRRFEWFARTGQTQPWGSPIAAAGPIRVSGGARRVPNEGRAAPPPPSLGVGWTCDRGYDWGWTDVTLRLPSNSTTVVARRYRTAASAPWHDTDYRVTFAVARWDDKQRRYSNVAVVRPLRPKRVGSSDVRIRLRTRPALQAALGRRIRVSGDTTPPLRNRWLRLRFHVSPESDRLFARDGPFARARVLATVRSDRHGRFAYDGWRAAYRRSYRVWAEYKPGPRVEAQSSCDVRLLSGLPLL